MMRTTQQAGGRKDFNVLSDEEHMKKARMVAFASASLNEGVELMEKNRLMNLPVEKSGRLPNTPIRLDLLRILPRAVSAVRDFFFVLGS